MYSTVEEILGILFRQLGKTTKFISYFPSFRYVFIKYESGTIEETVDANITEKLRICTRDIYSGFSAVFYTNTHPPQIYTDNSMENKIILQKYTIKYIGLLLLL